MARLLDWLMLTTAIAFGVFLGRLIGFFFVYIVQNL